MTTAMGLQQAQKDAQATEYQKQLSDAQTQAQNINQTEFALGQAQGSDVYQKANAMLQGQQAQSQNAAQQATYYTNMTPDEQDQARSQGYTNTNTSAPAVAKPTTAPTTAPTTINYSMPKAATTPAATTAAK